MEEKAKKTVIYIDAEDEITDIVNKIKQSKERIIALVPPKAVGILRSAVNLRILARTSRKDNKQIVLITNNSALLAMAGAAKIPVAKTLQSKPEIPEIDILEVDGEDIIDGEKLPVSEFTGKTTDQEEAEMLSNLDIDDNKSFSKKDPDFSRENKNKSNKSIKIPDFNSFRKKIFIFGGLGVFFIIFLVWAIFFAPSAKVIISAKTSNLGISETVKLSSDENNLGDKNLPLSVRTVEKISETSFDTTGVKEEGEAAKGIIRLSQSSESDPMTIKSGTAFSAGGCNFVTTETAVIPGARFSRGSAYRSGSTTVSIRATQIGEQCNLSPQSYISSISGVSATGEQLSGGSKTIKKIVSEADINNAKSKLAENDNEKIKAELIEKFGNDYIILKDSFRAGIGDAISTPSVNNESQNGKATLKATSVYTLSAISRKDVRNYLEASIKKRISNQKEQQIYKDGVDELIISNYSGDSKNASVKFQTTAKIGPRIDKDSLKKKLYGKQFGEVQSLIGGIDGVKNVDVKFSFFWVTRVPSNDKKIDIEFTVEK